MVVLEEAGAGRVPGLDVEVVAAPWDSKAPLEDLAGRVCAGLTPPGGLLRVLVAHGGVDALTPDPGNPAVIRLAGLEETLRSGLIHYVALGDRHSVTSVGETGRIWYAGTPLATDYGEVEPNQALLVELEGGSARVTAHPVSSWRFLDRRFDVNHRAEVEAVGQWLDSLPAKSCAIVRATFVGTLNLADKARLDEILEHYRDLLAALEVWDRHTDLVVRPDDQDLRDLGLVGFAATAVDEMRELAAGKGPEAGTAQDALSLLYRLVRRRA